MGGRKKRIVRVAGRGSGRMSGRICSVKYSAKTPH